MQKTIAAIKAKAPTIIKVYKILAHHEVYPLVLRIQYDDGEADSDVDTDNYKADDVQELEVFLKSMDIHVQEIDLSGEDIG